MIKIAIVVPYESMEKTAKEVFREHTRFMRERFHDAEEYSLEIITASTTDEILALQLDCDVIIARGGTYHDLRRRAFSIPLVELIVSGSDLVDMFLELRRLHGNTPAAILGTQNMVLGAEKLARQLDVDVSPYILQRNTQQEIFQSVKKAAHDGKKIIIGGKTGCRYAEAMGLSSMLMSSGRDSFWNAISEAKQLAKVSLEEREKALGLQALLDNAYEGLIAFDKNGRIFFINSSALEILQISAKEQYLGKKYSEVFSTAELQRILASSEEYIDEIVSYRTTHLSVKKLNLKIHGNQIGSVVTILNAAQIQDTEDKLRGKLYHKGYSAKYTFDNLITRSPKMLKCIQEAKAFARTDSNVVIVGESGTGKELFSQSIHNWSGRSKNNFVALNCAALPENLLESELFGYVEGAFTGASKGGKAGLFEVAHNGTIFIDEISEFPLHLQGRLLRVLQEREVMRLGDRKITPVNIRVIAATNRNLEELVSQGKFRQDLYYRLDVLRLNLPPLRERRDDIPLLVQDCIRQFRANGEFPDIPLSAGDYQLLQSQPWYGNVRELKNFCERLTVVYQPNVQISNLIQHLLNSPTAASPLHLSPVTSASVILQDSGALLAFIAECQGNKTIAAARLGISRVTLWRTLKRLGAQGAADD